MSAFKFCILTLVWCSLCFLGYMHSIQPDKLANHLGVLCLLYGLMTPLFTLVYWLDRQHEREGK